METIFRVTGYLCGEFTGHRSFDVFFHLRLNKQLSKLADSYQNYAAHFLWAKIRY